MRHFVTDPFIRVMGRRGCAISDKAELWDFAFVIRPEVSAKAMGQSVAVPKARAPPNPSRSHGDLQQERGRPAKLLACNCPVRMASPLGPEADRLGRLPKPEQECPRRSLQLGSIQVTRLSSQRNKLRMVALSCLSQVIFDLWMTLSLVGRIERSSSRSLPSTRATSLRRKPRHAVTAKPCFHTMPSEAIS